MLAHRVQREPGAGLHHHVELPVRQARGQVPGLRQGIGLHGVEVVVIQGQGDAVVAQVGEQLAHGFRVVEGKTIAVVGKAQRVVAAICRFGFAWLVPRVLVCQERLPRKSSGARRAEQSRPGQNGLDRRCMAAAASWFGWSSQ